MSGIERVLLVTVDSLRADHVGHLSDGETLTPAIDEFASQGTAYRQAMSHGPTTYLSFPSLLTGRHALTNPAFPHLRGPTIQHHLASTGYDTAGIIGSNAWLSPEYEYDRGFDEFHALGRGPRMANSRWGRLRHRIGDVLGDGVVYRAVKGLYDRFRDIETDDSTEEDRLHELAVDHLSTDGQTFTWVHYMTTHAPYVVDPKGATFLNEIPTEAAQRELIEKARDQPASVSEADQELLHDLYRESVIHVDRRIGDLLAAVDLSRTAVVIAADHGEAFWEHGYFEHPPELHQELLHVPLIIADPRTDNGDVVEQPVGLESVPRRLCEFADVEPFDGVPTDPSTELFAAVAHESQRRPQHSTADSLQVAVRADDWKYIHRVSGSDELFHLGSDPAETSSVRGDHEGTATELRSSAAAFGESLSLDGDVDIPDELEDQLQDLGYM